MKAVQKYSRKREAILDALRAANDHPSAETLYTRLKPRHPDLSMGTVYRNLALFAENGDAVCVGNVNGQDRYDARIAPHAHFVCTRCGAVADLDTPDALEALSGQVEAQTGGRVLRHNAVFFGLCADCLDKEGN